MADTASATQTVGVGPRRLDAILRVPDDPVGLVIFAHGAGSSRFSPRNTQVAEHLGKAGMATLLLDLLTEIEAANRARVFDIPLLSARVVDAIDWARAHPDLGDLPIGLFGSSTGAAAALVAAARRRDRVAAVVSRGGRPDLAGTALPLVSAPTLLIVGGADHVVIDLNKSAARAMMCAPRVEIVPGATHLFEEPGTLEQVIALATGWFKTHFARKIAR
ncbi:dienelactone hydrolase family protein [Sulfitobacter sabulilitoris]|uniref:Alpha/beta hydrolase n=1 Tax=Sulfitobacter sabulilitoris TaxID=2562655 RepID=A0A5S3PBV6_9RHOB|nr:dienelactone hydrolase family protein [Sulfitobacter sabulilitoris]TMM51067.1 alpha/beta hydrolase [Sulfitobacter sabulilitoris]